MAGPGFAVLELETTGIVAGDTGRVIEIAVVHLSAEGRIQGSWSTLVGPGPLSGAGRFRHAATSHLAPSFADVAPGLLGLLEGRVVVAHHAGFHLRFLVAELVRAGYSVPQDGGSALCTMQLARDFSRDFNPPATRSRGGCRLAFGMSPRTGPVTASTNAVATAELLAAFIDSTEDQTFWDRYLGHALEESWVLDVTGPTIEDVTTGPGAAWMPRLSGDAEPDHETHPFLGRIARQMRPNTGPAEHLDYLAFVDRCLIGGYLSASAALLHLSRELNIGTFTCEGLHHDYFVELSSLAGRRGELTSHQIGELWAVGELLDLPASVIRGALDAPRPSGVPQLLAG